MTFAATGHVPLALIHQNVLAY